jgi:hypothetical protein
MYYEAIAVDGSEIGRKFCYLEGVNMGRFSDQVVSPGRFADKSQKDFSC